MHDRDPRSLPPRVPRPAPPRTLPTPSLDAAVTPLVTPIPGDDEHRAVTFLWRGEAREVRVLANKLTHDTDAALMERTGDVWHRTYVVRCGWRASYRLRVDGVDLPDPLNPRSWNGFSVAGTAPPSPWLAPPAAPRHKLSRHPLGWSRAGPRPAAHLRPRLRGRPAVRRGTVIAGQSFGGLAAVHAAHRRPDRFAAALSQSGSFWWPNGPEYAEFEGGHDRYCWRDELAEGLIAIYG